ncbi:MAG TPA: GGDEF domain-containing protein [Abditibacteriaceae bacterium]
MATLDGLTGIYNRRAFEDMLGSEMRRATRYGLPLSLVILDVDKFKSYNDTYGHPAGDEILKSVAQLLKTRSRATDIPARYGGEEFVIILPATDCEGSQIMTGRMRGYIEEGPWTQRAITASFGIASLTPDISTGAELLALADKALYAAKESGRNRVVHIQSLDD